MAHTRDDAGARGRGFTIIELIVSIAVIALLIGIAVFGVRALTRTAKGTVAQSMVNQIATGVEKFKAEAGFIPPLVQDERVPVLPVAQWVVADPPPSRRYRIRVYDEVDDRAFLNTLDVPSNVDNNPFEFETRYSEVSIAYYLVGALDVPYKDDNATSDITIDGVKGPGLYKPSRGGEFNLPREVVSSNGQRAAGTPFESFVNLSSGGAKLAYGTAGEPREVRLVDDNGVPIRYYRWVNGNRPTGTPADTAPVVRTLADLKIPRLIGRYPVITADPMPEQTNFPTPADRDIRQNAELRSATWAIVAAGPNGVFGDETDLQALAQKIGRAYVAAEEAKIRAEAERDNVVKVGQ